MVPMAAVRFEGSRWRLSMAWIFSNSVRWRRCEELLWRERLSFLSLLLLCSFDLRLLSLRLRLPLSLLSALRLRWRLAPLGGCASLDLRSPLLPLHSLSDEEDSRP